MDYADCTKIFERDHPEKTMRINTNEVICFVSDADGRRESDVILQYRARSLQEKGKYELWKVLEGDVTLHLDGKFERTIHLPQGTSFMIENGQSYRAESERARVQIVTTGIRQQILFEI